MCAYMELRIASRAGINRLPFSSDRIEFKVDSRTWACSLAGSVVRFECEADSLSTTIGEEIVLDKARVRVVDRRTAPPFWLISLSPDLELRTWPIESGQTLIGRPGKRNNNIVLSHPSISRAHATIEANQGGAVLQADSAVMTALNGTPLAPSDSRKLSTNDILQLGDFHFRWETEETTEVQTHRLAIFGLGKSRVEINGVDVVWRHEQARDLLFWMASRRDSDLPVAHVLEEYWPERPVLRQRKNLSQVLRNLENELGLPRPLFEQLVVRTSETLRLRSDAVASCDFWRLRSTTRDDLPSSLAEFSGVFCPTNDRPWARSVRRELMLLWLAALQDDPRSREKIARILALVGEALREIDFDDGIYRAAYRLAEALGRPEQAEVWCREAEAH